MSSDDAIHFQIVEEKDLEKSKAVADQFYRDVSDFAESCRGHSTYTEKPKIQEYILSLKDPYNIHRFLTRAIPDTHHKMLVVRSQSQIIGIRFFSEEGKLIRSYLTALRPLFQGKKIAQRLTFFFLDYARSKGFKEIIGQLETKAAIAWHEKWEKKGGRALYSHGKKIGEAETIRVRPALYNPDQKTVHITINPFPTKESTLDPPPKRWLKRATSVLGAFLRGRKLRR